jgi:hypothetical protein
VTRCTSPSWWWRHRQHDAGEDVASLADHGELAADGGAVTGTAVEAQGVFDAVAAVVSTSPTYSWRSRTTASTSSSSPGHSCGTP